MIISSSNKPKISRTAPVDVEIIMCGPKASQESIFEKRLSKSMISEKGNLKKKI